MNNLRDFEVLRCGVSDKHSSIAQVPMIQVRESPAQAQVLQQACLEAMVDLLEKSTCLFEEKWETSSHT